jgi:2-oxoisovalerate dehydrogenase E2 component (dihydrolipoyl transacylase)
LVSMETAKAVVDVPAPQSGIIKKLYGKVGDIIKTGDPLVEFAAKEAVSTASEPPAASVVGKTEVGNIIIEEAAMGITPTVSSSAAIKAMPAVRALAKQLAVDLATVQGSGAGGQITAEDVKAASQKTGGAVSTPMAQTGTTVEPLRGVRRAMANAMAQSHKEIVPVTIVDDADINSWAAGTDITARVIRAIVAACHAEPALNAHFDSEKLERHLYKEINLGMAMDSKDGLFVPVLKNVAASTPAMIRQTIERFKTEVKTRAIPADDLKGNTIQLSNFGTFAGRYATPILVPPIVAILGTGRIRNEVVAVNGAIAIHRILPLSLTIDHRAVTGGEAARFLAAVISDLSKES